MAEGVLAQHPPAMKVGGRRLSVTSRPKPHGTAGQKSPSPINDGPPDYPRPAAPADQPQEVHDPQEDEVPKKEKKQGHGALEHERRLQESLYRKAEQNRPKKDGIKSSNGAAGTRIAQPAGKGFVV